MNTSSRCRLLPRSWPSVAQAVGETLVEFLAPAPNGLIGNDNSAFTQKHLDIPQAEAEHLVQPDSTADDLGRKAMAGGDFILLLLSVFCQAVSARLP
jgi:hypothetical protein